MNVHWFPGHMSKALREIDEKLKIIDLIIEIVDARAPLSSRNPNLMNNNKPRLIVMSKVDLADPSISALWKTVFEKDNIKVVGMDLVKKFNEKIIMKEANRLMKEKFKKDALKGMKKRAIRAMVIGIPNVGKSTFINSLTKSRSAGVGNIPGFTKGQQWVKTSEMELLDTPGVLWPKFEDKAVGIKLALIGTIKDEIIKKEELANYCIDFLVSKYPQGFKARYDLVNFDNILNDIAVRRGFLISGGNLDISRSQNLLLKEFKDGIITRVSLERPGEDNGFFGVREQI